MFPEQRILCLQAHRSLGRDRRLRKNAELKAVLRQGKSWANHLVVLWMRPNGMETSRFGFSVGRRVGNAVVRNRVKRRLRDLVRHAPLLEGWDMVIIARARASEVDFQQLRRAVHQLFTRADVIQIPVTSDERST